VCVLQIVTLLAALAPTAGRPLSSGVAATGLVLLVWSFAVDTAWLWRRRAAGPA
jgi:hypothetical protein